MLITIFYIAVVSLLTCQMLVPVISRLAIQFGGVDKPDQRKVHSVTVPRLGGVAIILGFMVAILFFVEDESHLLRGILLGAMMVFLTGLVDDIVGLRPVQKLAGQAFGILVFIVIGGVRLTSLGHLPGIGEILLGIWAVPVTLFVMLGVVNALNLLDGLDGLAGGVGLIASLCFAILAYRTDNTLLLFLAAGLCGSLLGFLVYNTYPARIFMGDSGSLLIGYLLAVFSVVLVESDHGRISTTTPVMILFLPVLDTLSVMFRRWRNAVKIFSADRTHVHHRLLDMGIGHRQSVLIVYGVSYLYGLAAVIWYQASDIVLLGGMICSGGVLYLLLHCFKSMLISRSSESSLKSSGFYCYIIEKSSLLFWGVKYLILMLLLGTVLVHHTVLWLQIVSWFLAFCLLSSMFVRKELRDKVLLITVYLSTAVLVFRQVNYGEQALFLGSSYLALANAGYVLLAAAVLVKGLLRKRLGLLIDRPFEYLLLLVALSVPLLPLEWTATWHLTAVAAKCLILFAALKLVLISDVRGNRKVITSLIAALLLTW